MTTKQLLPKRQKRKAPNMSEQHPMSMPWLNWKPYDGGRIETNRDHVLVYMPGGSPSGPIQGCRVKDGNIEKRIPDCKWGAMSAWTGEEIHGWIGLGHMNEERITLHWMPLPQPPKAGLKSASDEVGAPGVQGSPDTEELELAKAIIGGLLDFPTSQSWLIRARSFLNRSGE